MDYPATYMPAARVMMGPMDHAALCIPNILTIEAYAVSDLEAVDAWGEIDVVGNQERLS